MFNFESIQSKIRIWIIIIARIGPNLDKDVGIQIQIERHNLFHEAESPTLTQLSLMRVERKVGCAFHFLSICIRFFCVAIVQLSLFCFPHFFHWNQFSFSMKALLNSKAKHFLGLNLYLFCCCCLLVLNHRPEDSPLVWIWYPYRFIRRVFIKRHIVKIYEIKIFRLSKFDAIQ